MGRDKTLDLRDISLGFLPSCGTLLQVQEEKSKEVEGEAKKLGKRCCVKISFCRIFRKWYEFVICKFYKFLENLQLYFNSGLYNFKF